MKLRLRPNEPLDHHARRNRSIVLLRSYDAVPCENLCTTDAKAWLSILQQRPDLVVIRDNGKPVALQLFDYGLIFQTSRTVPPDHSGLKPSGRSARRQLSSVLRYSSPFPVARKGRHSRLSLSQAQISGPLSSMPMFNGALLSAKCRIQISVSPTKTTSSPLRRSRCRQFVRWQCRRIENAGEALAGLTAFD
jgi:hypothetical protein